jgi:uncharacterized iron-regulated membrane protein
VVLAAFGLGLIAGVLGMVPRWWKHRKAAAHAQKPAPAPANAETPAPVTSSDTISSIHGI